MKKAMIKTVVIYGAIPVAKKAKKEWDNLPDKKKQELRDKATDVAVKATNTVANLRYGKDKGKES